MRPCWQAFAVAIISFATPSVAETFQGTRLLAQVRDFSLDSPTAEAARVGGLVGMPSAASELSPDRRTPVLPLIPVAGDSKRHEPDSVILAFMSGKCSTLKIAGRNFACRAVAFYQTEQGRANFTIALDDPADNSHTVTFSGENARREQDNLYELSVDRMLLKSKDRPKVDGLPEPLVETSTGTCKQVGIFLTGLVSSISCSATNVNGKKYDLHFESDGSPIRLMRLTESPVPTEKRRARQVEQFGCRLKADEAKVLPRDRAAYIIQCLGEDSQAPTPAVHQ
jgi:hypothetical protein